MEFSDLVKERRSVKSYLRDQGITDAELREIFEEVILSPSAFNLQQWVFVAVRDPETKLKLKEVAWGQQQVETCSVAFLVCGKLNAHRDAPVIHDDAPDEIKQRMLPMIHDFYEGKAQLQRDEAIRGASLAAMSLMYAARNRGWATGPMIGFDPEKAAELLHLDENTIPVMLIVLGRQDQPPRPRAYRRPLEEVVRMNALDGPGLKG